MPGRERWLWRFLQGEEQYLCDLLQSILRRSFSFMPVVLQKNNATR